MITFFILLVFRDLLSVRSFVNFWRRLVIRFFFRVVAALIFRHETLPFCFSDAIGRKRGGPGYRSTSYAGGAAGRLRECALTAIYGYHDRQDDDDGFAALARLESA